MRSISSAMDTLPIETIIEIVTDICKKYRVQHLKLIGSFATNTNTPRSDIDFALYGCEDFEAVERAVAQIDTLRKIDLFVVETIGNPYLLEDIEKYGRQIY